MQVLLLMYQDEKAMQRLPKEEFGRIHGAFVAYVDALKKAGVLVANNGLRPTGEARTVRKTNVLDGPFAETKEQLAVPTAAYGAVEVRPVWT
ncbi:MAG TPA: YciI family protein [Burkholderiales bacterium]|nr:YciI family protein [Burkholderiales bacterium]